MIKIVAFPLLVAGLPVQSLAAVVSRAPSSVSLSVSAAPVPAFQTTAAPFAPGASLALPALSAPLLPAPAPVAAAPVGVTASAVAAALESAGDLSRLGAGDSRDLGARVQALLSGGAAAREGAGPSDPVAARPPAQDSYAAVRALSLDRYKAEFQPWPGVPGYFRIVVTGPVGVWESYGVLGTNLALGRDQQIAEFTAKLERALNAGQTTVSALDELAKSHLWPSNLQSRAYARINGMKLPSHRAALQPWAPVPGHHQIVVTGPEGVWASYGVAGDRFAHEDDGKAVLFAARIESALNSGRLKLAELGRLTNDFEWPAKLDSRANAKINSTPLTRFKASFTPWPGVPGHFTLKITGPHGVWESYGVDGRRLESGEAHGLSLFVAKLEKALNSGVVALSDLKSLQMDYRWPELALATRPRTAQK